MIDWLFTNALAALALAAIAGVLIWTFRPSPAVRHALWLVVVLKLVSPTGLVVSLPLPVERPTAAVAEPVVEAPPESTEFIVEEELFTVIVTPRPGQSVEEAAAMAIHGETATRSDRKHSTETAIVASSPQSSTPPFDYRPYLIGLWALGALASRVGGSCAARSVSPGLLVADFPPAIHCSPKWPSWRIDSAFASPAFACCLV